MSEGFGQLMVIGGALKQLWICSSYALFFVCMQSLKQASVYRRRKGLQMHLPSKRFFYHIEGFFFLFLFLRGALT